jgi:tetratricopeptide (TPR) repeat protein
MALGRPGLSIRGAVACLAVMVFVAPAFAQHAVMVFGGGNARRCYEAVKDKALPFKALEICDLALEQEDLSQKNRAATHNNRGILHMRAGRHDRAMKDYQAGIKLSPDMPEAKINLGAMLYYLGRYSEAVAALDEGVKIEDTEARAAAYYNRGLAQEMLGEVEKAYVDYKTALSLDPGLSQAERQLRRFRVVPAAG